MEEAKNAFKRTGFWKEAQKRGWLNATDVSRMFRPLSERTNLLGRERNLHRVKKLYSLDTLMWTRQGAKYTEGTRLKNNIEIPRQKYSRMG